MNDEDFAVVNGTFHVKIAECMPDKLRLKRALSDEGITHDLFFARRTGIVRTCRRKVKRTVLQKLLGKAQSDLARRLCHAHNAADILTGIIYGFSADNTETRRCDSADDAVGRADLLAQDGIGCGKRHDGMGGFVDGGTVVDFTEEQRAFDDLRFAPDLRAVGDQQDILACCQRKHGFQNVAVGHLTFCNALVLAIESVTKLDRQDVFAVSQKIGNRIGTDIDAVCECVAARIGDFCECTAFIIGDMRLESVVCHGDAVDRCLEIAKSRDGEHGVFCNGIQVEAALDDRGTDVIGADPNGVL